MYRLDEEGALVEDFSSIPYIPDYMCTYSFIVQEGKIFTVGGLNSNEEYRCAQIYLFNGMEWIRHLDYLVA